MSADSARSQATASSPSASLKLLEQLGGESIGLLERFGALVSLFLAVTKRVIQGRTHWRNTFQQMALIGVDSLPIALVTALSVGMVFTLQIANEFIRFGAQSVIGGVSAMALVRELSPTLTGVVVAGRVGAAIAAELGSMKVTEQIDALVTLATDPIDYLVVPRVLACVVMMPVLAFLADLVGLAGGLGVAVLVKGITSTLYLDSIQDLLGPGDVLRGLVKAAVFGGIVGVIGCQQGITTSNGAKGVGKSTTDSVVFALITIFVSNYFLSLLLFPGRS
jgi:phospholipid/cholesterol/gamma-HCH transport system permease protein